MRRQKPNNDPHALNTPSLLPNINSPQHVSHSIKNDVSSGTSSENLREINQSREKSAGARTTCSTVDKQSDAAGRLENEDDIGNECDAMEKKSENIENKKDKLEIKEDKTNKEDFKTIKLTKQEVKKNKTISKIKIEAPKPELKSILKNKEKTRTAKSKVVNTRKITEFLLPSQDREKNPNFSKPQNPAIEPAMQENKIEPNSLSTFRKGGGIMMGKSLNLTRGM